MLKFYSKVASQQLLSLLPGGSSVYRWLQCNITKSIPPTKSLVQERINRGQNYLRVLDNLKDGDIIQRGTHLEIGAGCHFIIPLMLYEMGCDKQILTDLKRDAHSDSVFPVVEMISECKYSGYSQKRTLPSTDGHDLESYLAKLGIEYKAPSESRLPVPDESISVVTMTSVLEYIPRSSLRQFFEDVKRVLVPGGYFLAIINLVDQFNTFDPSISRFNFLRYSEKTWDRWYCNKFQTLNRMRPSDYKAMFDELPFTTEVWDVSRPTSADYSQLSRIKVNSEFANHNSEDLASTELFFAMKRE